MADTARNNLVLRLAELLEEHNGANTVVLDIHEQSSWTDYFIITTVSSQAHMRGVARYVNSFLKEYGISVKPLLSFTAKRKMNMTTRDMRKKRANLLLRKLKRGGF